MHTSVRSFVIGVYAVLLVFSGSALLAQEEQTKTVSYPITELGDCGTKEECRVYCDDLVHKDACIEWARDHGMQVSQEQRTGPGGCNSRQACHAYCSEQTHREECVLFAVSEGRMDKKQADKVLRALRGDVDIPRIIQPRIDAPHIEVEVKHSIDVEKVQKLLQEQEGPGGCDSFSVCEAYCNDSEHEDECLAYAEEHDLLPKEELDHINRLRMVEGPGGCRGRMCEQYCDAPGREKECLEFARSEGFIAEDEYIKIKKFVDLEGPGGCRGRMCEQYCEDSAHRKECFMFARENGLIDEKEAEAIDRIQNKLDSAGGPGGCRDEMACRAYCMDQSHFDECAAFAVDVGLMPPDQAQMLLKQFIEAEQFGTEGPPGGFHPSTDGMGPPAGFEHIERFDKDEFPAEYRAEFERRMLEFEKFREQFGEGDKEGYGMQRMPPVETEYGRQIPEGDSQPHDVPVPPSSLDVLEYQKQYNDQFQAEFQKQFEEQYREQYQQEFQQRYDTYAPSADTPYEFFQQPPPEYSSPSPGSDVPVYTAPDSSFPLPSYEVSPVPAGASPFQVFLDLFGL